MLASTTPTRPASPVAGLAAPSMSTSSSTSSFPQNMWSAQPSRRGSDASSIASLEMMPVAKKDPAPATSTTQQSAAAPVAAPPVRRTYDHNVDPLRRQYPKPEGTLNVQEALSREPLPWSLGHWCKYAKDKRPVSANAEDKKQRFQDAKDDLLRSFTSMNNDARYSKGPAQRKD